jgi:hypothetical protein
MSACPIEARRLISYRICGVVGTVARVVKKIILFELASAYSEREHKELARTTTEVSATPIWANWANWANWTNWTNAGPRRDLI